MLSGKEVIKGNWQEAWIKAHNQPSVSANINHLEKNLFWTSLPRCDGQLLMLHPNQMVDIGISLAEGFYSAESQLVKLGNSHERFYAFAIPKTFEKTQERQFLRVPFAINVIFESAGLSAQSASINCSGGGVMVYLVPDLKKIIDAGQEITMSVNVGNERIYLPMMFSWENKQDGISMAGFEFIDADPEVHDKFTDLIHRFSGTT
jgi:hypothetical protein